MHWYKHIWTPPERGRQTVWFSPLFFFVQAFAHSVNTIPSLSCREFSDNNSNNNHNTDAYCFWCGSLVVRYLISKRKFPYDTLHKRWGEKWANKHTNKVKICFSRRFFLLLLLPIHSFLLAEVWTWIQNMYLSIMYALWMGSMMETWEIFFWLLAHLNAIFKCHYCNWAECNIRQIARCF